jgi:DNA-directed RNA polymerase specialized sigma subunit
MKETCERLNEYRDIKAKIAIDNAEIREMENACRRLQEYDDTQYYYDKIDALKKEVFDNESEIRCIDSVLKSLENEPYGELLRLRYIDKKSPQQIAMKLYCDQTTIYRQEKNLMRRICTRLYGVGVRGR